jgi:cell wall-associated NlpC family hydrolase
LRDLIGIPFVDRGRDRNGADCWGIALLVLRHFGHTVPDFDVSCFDTLSIHAIYDGELARWAWQKVEIPEPGDLAVMRIDARFPEMVQHVGVYIGGGRVLHTMKKRESHLIRVDDPYWSRKIEGYYRWAG